MRKSLVLGSIAALGFAGAALADESLNYSFVEGSYINANDFNLDGWGVNGSYAFTKNVHGFAGYSRTSFDNFPVDADSFNVGLGFNWPLTSKIDAIGRVSYLSTDLSPGPSNDGFGLSARLRGTVLPNVELEGGVNYSDYGRNTENTTVDVGGRYFFAPNFALGADVDVDDGNKTWTVSLRYNFPTK